MPFAPRQRNRALEKAGEVTAVCAGAGWAVSGRIAAQSAMRPIAMAAAMMNWRMTGLSSLGAKRYGALRLRSALWRRIRLAGMNRFTGSGPMAGDPVATLPVRRDPGAGRCGVIGRGRVVGRWRRHDERRDEDADAAAAPAVAIAIVVPPGIGWLGRGGGADGGEAYDGAGGGDFAGEGGGHFSLHQVELFDAFNLGAAHSTLIQETS